MIKFDKYFDGYGNEANLKFGSFDDIMFIKYILNNEREILKNIAKEAKKAMTAAQRKAKSREKAKSKGGIVLGGVVLTSKAADQLSILCYHTGLNKTQVINKLLEEQEQLKLL